MWIAIFPVHPVTSLIPLKYRRGVIAHDKRRDGNEGNVTILHQPADSARGFTFHQHSCRLERPEPAELRETLGALGASRGSPHGDDQGDGP